MDARSICCPIREGGITTTDQRWSTARTTTGGRGEADGSYLRHFDKAPSSSQQLSDTVTVANLEQTLLDLTKKIAALVASSASGSAIADKVSCIFRGRPAHTAMRCYSTPIANRSAETAVVVAAGVVVKAIGTVTSNKAVREIEGDTIHPTNKVIIANNYRDLQRFRPLRLPEER